MSKVVSCDEIEQRFIIDPLLWLYLPRDFKIYHQAEIGSGDLWVVLDKFYTKARQVLEWKSNQSTRDIEDFLWKFDGINRIKLRIRNIFDPEKHTVAAQFTAKIRTDHPEFKIYQEHNLDIDPAVGLSLIQQIAPPHNTWAWNQEFWVRKLRYNIAGPDGMLWDVDVLQWLNAGIHIWEIEVPSIDTSFQLPTWAVKKVNGDPKYSFLGTKNLQKTPWALLSAEKRALYLSAIK